MRTRFLSVIAAFLLISVGMTACLDSDQELVFSTDATIQAFSLDTIHGVDYKFEIDQLNNLIYNPDSLPVDADTIIDSIRIDKLTAGMGVMTSDTALDLEAYHDLRGAINATGQNGIKLTVVAPDASTQRIYTLQIRVHRQDPDSLSWVRMDTVGDVFSTTPVAGPLKLVAWQDNLFLYTSPTEMYRTDGDPAAYAWQRNSVSGLPAEADVTTLVGDYQGCLYMLAAGDVYRSDYTGTSWARVEELSGGVQALLAVLPYNAVSGQPATLAAIRVDETGTARFCTTSDASQAWVGGDVVPDGFPTKNISWTYYLTGAGVGQAMLAGMPSGDGEKTIPWVTNNGRLWTSLETNREGMWCPALDNPFLLHYGDQFYLSGGNLDAIYGSLSGIGWQEQQRKFLLPADFAGKTSYTVALAPTAEGTTTAADKRNFIWVVFGGNGTPNEVWRGRLNRLGFERE